MAPTKKDGEKEAKFTPQESAKAIMDYLRKENRPYSATDISGNLHNRVTKTLAQKLLKDMHERKEIEGRASGKQLVYHVIQGETDPGQAEKLEALDAETKRLIEETNALRSEEKDLRASLRGDNVKVPLPALKASIGVTEKAKSEVELRLVGLRSGSLKPVSANEKDKITKGYRKMKNAAEARKKIRKYAWDMILEASQAGKEKQEELKEDLDLDF